MILIGIIIGIMIEDQTNLQPYLIFLAGNASAKQKQANQQLSIWNQHKAHSLVSFVQFQSTERGRESHSYIKPVTSTVFIAMIFRIKF